MKPNKRSLDIMRAPSSALSKINCLNLFQLGRVTVVVIKLPLPG